MGCGFAISPVVGVMTQDESKKKETLYIFIYIYIEIRNKQITPALEHLGYHKSPPVKWKPLTHSLRDSQAHFSVQGDGNEDLRVLYQSVGMQRKGKRRL